MFNVLKDIISGALPVGEIPGFLTWRFGVAFWFLLGAAILIGLVVLSN